jgi:glutamate synthase domain-containing protein 2
VAARRCNTNNCPSGVATQKPELRKRLDVGQSALRLARFLEAAVELMQVMARACGHDDLHGFNLDDLSTWNRDIALLSGIRYAGVRDPG